MTLHIARFENLLVLDHPLSSERAAEFREAVRMVRQFLDRQRPYTTDALPHAGAPAEQLARRHGIQANTIRLWRTKYAGMTVSDVTRLKQLEEGKYWIRS